jgi:hypothetical protein
MKVCSFENLRCKNSNCVFKNPGYISESNHIRVMPDRSLRCNHKLRPTDDEWQEEGRASRDISDRFETLTTDHYIDDGSSHAQDLK